MNQVDAWETHLQHQEERQSLRHPGHHPVNVGHLVMGVAFLGLFVVWLLVTTGTVALEENRWLLPAQDRLILINSRAAQSVAGEQGGRRTQQWIYRIYALSENCRVIGEPRELLPLGDRIRHATAIDGWLLFSTQTETLAILAQQNTANAMYPFQGAVNFNIQNTQGGSVFAPGGDTVYSAFDIAPLQNPPARTNISQLMLSDADNLLIRMGIQMPENLAGKMVISSDGNTVYALSESGFIILPVSTIAQSPLAVLESEAVLLVNDQCGVAADQRVARVSINNAGRGRVTATAQLLPATPPAARRSPGSHRRRGHGSRERRRSWHRRARRRPVARRPQMAAAGTRQTSPIPTVA